ncbi:hypothetical protein NW768_004618 [Fusarium equiseti]|uniref:Uncharacterized protein n=1 Tax=Fusarium equiseti TaxID=61235 RepID=A0ABQ8RGW8_FUSEQ|nr:hypothetical protein NW768_004618 [Fusarium equiseti]
MAPACCIISVESEPKPPNCEAILTKGTETISSNSVNVRFSHTTYSFLYERVEKNELTFDNRQDTEGWKKLIPFCEVSGSPEKLKAFDEIKPEKFKELLSISEEDWDTAWNSSTYTKLIPPYPSASNCFDALSKELWKENKAAEKKAIKEEKERKKTEKKEESKRKKTEKKEERERKKAKKREEKDRNKVEKRERKDREKRDKEK